MIKETCICPHFHNSLHKKPIWCYSGTSHQLFDTCLCSEISCYTCRKSNRPTSTVSPDEMDQPVCSDTHLKKCPAGTQFCVSGTFGIKLEGFDYKTDYIKDCGKEEYRNCSKFGEQFKNTSFEFCEIEACNGNLCNNKTAAQVQSLGKFHLLYLNV